MEKWRVTLETVVLAENSKEAIRKAKGIVKKGFFIKARARQRGS